MNVQLTRAGSGDDELLVFEKILHFLPRLAGHVPSQNVDGHLSGYFVRDFEHGTYHFCFGFYAVDFRSSVLITCFEFRVENTYLQSQRRRESSLNWINYVPNNIWTMTSEIQLLLIAFPGNHIAKPMCQPTISQCSTCM